MRRDENKIKFTKAQEDFVNSDARYIIVSAGAGSGKTTALLERIVRLINKGAKLEEMIITTFTNASAFDLRYKITSSGIKSTSSYKEVSTFHGLASRFVRDYFYILGVDPLFRIGDESDCNLLLQLAIEEVVQNALQEKVLHIDKLYSVFLIGRKAQKLYSMLYNIYNTYRAKYKGIEELEAKARIYHDKEEFCKHFEAKFFELDNPKDFVDTIVEIIKRVDKCYQKKKEAKNILDFADLEDYFLELIKFEPKVIESIKYIFVDEYQDTNQKQEEILSIFEKQCNCVFVGDYKQSIYSFRHTDPKYFVNKYNRYKEQSSNGNKAYEAIDFLENFRSGKEICEFVNCVFSKQLNNYGNLISKVQKPSVVQVFENANYIDIIEYIKLKMEQGADFSDFAIISRKASDADPLIQYFDKLAIPYIINVDIDIFKDKTIKRILAILKVIYNRNDEIAMASALKFVLDETELFEFVNPKGLSYAIEHLDTKKFCKVRAFLQRLDYYFDISQNNALAVVLQNIISDFDYQNVLYLQKNGKRKVAVLNAFLDFLYEHDYTLDELLLLLENNASKKVPYVSDSYGIQVLTIHKAKGLEFEHVILIGVERQFNLSDINADYIISNEYGLLLKFFDFEKVEKRENIVFEKNKSLEKQKQLEEELRIMYVGLTRAKTSLGIFAKKTKRAIAFSQAQFLKVAKEKYEFVQCANREENWDYEIGEVLFSKFDEEIVQRLKAKYNFALPAPILAKDTVTNIQARQNKKDCNIGEKGFRYINRDANFALMRGTTYHKLLEEADFLIIDNKLKCLLRQEDTKLNNAILLLNKYFESKLSIEKDEDIIIRKEQSFILNKNGTLVQGVIDLLIINKEKAFVIDYKTGRLKDYSVQLNIYQEAVTTLLDKKTSGAILFLDIPKLVE